MLIFAHGLVFIYMFIALTIDSQLLLDTIIYHEIDPVHSLASSRPLSAQYHGLWSSAQF